MENSPIVGPIKTKFLILSDTHAKDVPLARAIPEVDVVIHCGDLTENSTLDEYASSLEFLTALKAPLKIVVPGTHDFTLDTQTHQQMAAHNALPVDASEAAGAYGKPGEAKRMFHRLERERGVALLTQEGVRVFHLRNGARLAVYASPYTPSRHRGRGGFEYLGRVHGFDIPRDLDLVITHGPPQGVLDVRDRRIFCDVHTGCPKLFDAVARARPRVHCFGQVHEEWGAERITWKDMGDDGDGKEEGELITRKDAVDEEDTVVVKKLADMRISAADLKDRDQGKVDFRKQCERQGYVHIVVDGDDKDERPLVGDGETLFINAAIDGRTTKGKDRPRHLPWVVDIDLPRLFGHEDENTSEDTSEPD